jgi:threonine aldolase
MKDLRTLSHEYKIPIHLDGARIWNAITEMKKYPAAISNNVDSLTVCLSKGLGAPVGSLLVGSHYFITKARRIRKALGGGMRQSGILAAAGIQALDDFESGILENDHIRAKKIEKEMTNVESFRCHKVDTNIIFIDILQYNNEWDYEDISKNISNMFKNRGILISAWSPLLLRIVIHRDINDNDIEYIIQNIKDVSHTLSTINSRNDS